MKLIRSGAVLVIIAVLGITGTVVIIQQMRIRGLGNSLRSLAAQNRGLSATNASLLSVEEDQNEELIRLRQQPQEVLRLRSLLTRAWEQLAAARAANQALIAQSTNAFAGYVTREQLEFVGYDTPENSFQSLNWAAMSGDYTNWLAALAPAARQEELADTNNLERFRRSNNGISGWQILASKPVGSDRVELEVEVDSQNSAAVFIYPMVAIGNEWKLGDDINPYTHAWDSPAVAQ